MVILIKSDSFAFFVGLATAVSHSGQVSSKIGTFGILVLNDGHNQSFWSVWV